LVAFANRFANRIEPIGFFICHVVIVIDYKQGEKLLFPFFSTIISFVCITATIYSVLAIWRENSLEAPVSYVAPYDVLKISLPVMIAWQLSPLFLAALSFLGINAKMKIFSLYSIIIFISLLIILPFFFDPQPPSFFTEFILHFRSDLPTIMLLGLMSGFIAWPKFTVAPKCERE